MYTDGLILAGCLVYSIWAALWPCSGAAGRLRLDLLLLTAIELTVLFVPSANAAFDYRYSLPCLVVMPIATELTTTRSRKSYHLVTEVTGRVRETS